MNNCEITESTWSRSSLKVYRGQQQRNVVSDAHSRLGCCSPLMGLHVSVWGGPGLLFHRGVFSLLRSGNFTNSRFLKQFLVPYPEINHFRLQSSHLQQRLSEGGDCQKEEAVRRRRSQDDGTGFQHQKKSTIEWKETGYDYLTCHQRWSKEEGEEGKRKVEVLNPGFSSLAIVVSNAVKGRQHSSSSSMILTRSRPSSCTLDLNISECLYLTSRIHKVDLNFQ
jgi:hypothetical protein